MLKTMLKTINRADAVKDFFIAGQFLASHTNCVTPYYRTIAEYADYSTFAHR